MNAAVLNDPERALSALNALSPDCPRDQWVRIAAAAKSAGLTLADFDRWSAGAPKRYDTRAVRELWRSLRPDGGIGPGTLFRLAREHGWTDALRPQAPRPALAGAPAPAPRAPIPADAPPPPERHPRFGKPSATWTYRDECGRVLFHVCRFDHKDGSKEFGPLTFDGTAWKWKAPPAPRPLYGLDRLAARPDAPVIVCEGEKAADAAQRLLPAAVAVCSPNGAQAATRADWSPLAGRRVLLWPDADEPGERYARAVAEQARTVGARVDGQVDAGALAGGRALPEGWDAADAEAEGISVPSPDALPLRPATDSPADRLAAALTPFSAAELEAAREPWPHAWSDGERGLFPVGEVSVIAAPGREGKTFATVALAGALASGLRVGGMAPPGDRCAVVFSAEDDRAQYARKVAAWASRLGQAERERVRARVIVPDLASDALAPLATLVTVADRAPIETGATDAAIAAIEAAAPTFAAPPGLLIFETASTLSDAEEDNRGFRVLIRALRRIARALNVAVVLVHHTSQAAAAHLPELTLSIADMRGGTALAYNSRQNFMLVNLGSAAEPFPDNDARAVLRQMAAPKHEGRVAALIPLDSSKSADPPPLFFGWGATPYGPALSVLRPPEDVAGLPWRALHARLRGERAERRAAARGDACAANVRRVVEIVQQLRERGKHATARAVSVEAGHWPGWATQYLTAAVEAGELVADQERIPRTSGLTTVYRPAEAAHAPL